MKNVLNFTNQFIKDVNVSESLLDMTPTTSKGMLFRLNAIKNIKESAISLKWLISLYEDARTNHAQDPSVMEFANNILSNVLKNEHAVRIGYLHESLMESDNVFHIEASKAIDACINLGENSIGASVLGGDLSKYKSQFPDLRIIENAVVQENINNNKAIETSDVSIYSPLSYTQDIGENKIVRVENHIFAISESTIIPTKAPNTAFLNFSNAALAIQFNEGVAKIKTSLGELFISEEGIGKVIEGENTIVETDTLIKEYTSAVSNHKIDENEMTKLDNIIAVSNKYDSYSVLESFKVVKNNVTKETALIAENNGKVFGGILESARAFKSFKVFGSITEAVNFVNQTIGVDASNVFVSEMEAEKEANDKKEDSLKEVDTEKSNLEAKKKQVGESIERVEEGSAAYEKYIELDALISEALVENAKKRKNIVDGVSVVEADIESLSNAEMTKLFDRLKSGTTFKGGVTKHGKVVEIEFKVGRKSKSVKHNVETITLTDIENPKGAKYKLFKRSSGNVTLAFSNMPAFLVSVSESVDYTSIVEQKEGDDKAYDKFLDDKLKGMGKKSIGELSDDETKKFFDEVEKEWKADDEDDTNEAVGGAGEIDFDRNELIQALIKGYKKSKKGVEELIKVLKKNKIVDVDLKYVTEGSIDEAVGGNGESSANNPIVKALGALIEKGVDITKLLKGLKSDGIVDKKLVLEGAEGDVKDEGSGEDEDDIDESSKKIKFFYAECLTDDKRSKKLTSKSTDLEGAKEEFSKMSNKDRKNEYKLYIVYVDDSVENIVNSKNGIITELDVKLKRTDESYEEYSVRLVAMLESSGNVQESSKSLKDLESKGVDESKKDYTVIGFAKDEGIAKARVKTEQASANKNDFIKSSSFKFKELDGGNFAVLASITYTKEFEKMQSEFKF